MHYRVSACQTPQNYDALTNGYLVIFQDCLHLKELRQEPANQSTIFNFLVWTIT